MQRNTRKTGEDFEKYRISISCADSPKNVILRSSKSIAFLSAVQTHRKMLFSGHSVYRQIVMIKVNVQVKLPLYRPRQATRGPGGWGFQDFQTVCTWRWQGCQHYAPVPLAPRGIPWYSLLLYAKLTPATEWCRKITSMKNLKDPIGNRTRNNPACNAVLPRIPPCTCHFLLHDDNPLQ
jgi:hypothetical protein